MFKAIVVGFGGRADGAQDALALARALAANGATLHLVDILEIEGLPARSVNRDYEAAMVDDANARLDRARDEISGLEVVTHVVSARSVAHGLEDTAATVGADLVAVGSCRRGRLGRLIAGDDTRAVLQHAKRPVAIAPAGFAAATDWRVGTIGLGFDETAESEFALGIAATLRAETHARLEAVEVLAPHWPIGVPDPAMEMPSEDELLHVQERLLAHTDIDTGKVVIAPTATSALRDLADRSDLLVVGSRPRSPFGRVLFGSTASALTHDVGCPLLVVPYVTAA